MSLWNKWIPLYKDIEYGGDTIHVITEDGINWYTIDSSQTVKDTTSILKNYWKGIKNMKIKIK